MIIMATYGLCSLSIIFLILTFRSVIFIKHIDVSTSDNKLNEFKIKIDIRINKFINFTLELARLFKMLIK